MPDITETTPRESYTIAGETFKIPLPYTAGMVLSSNEASALNQTWAENARNNFAKKVTEAKTAGSYDQSVMQGALDDYLDAYEFGVRTGGGGRTGDPVMAEAMNIARDLVRKALVKAGHKLADVSAKQITDLARAAIDSGKNPQILVTAKERVDAAKEIQGIEIGDLPVVEPATEEATPKKGKAA